MADVNVQIVVENVDDAIVGSDNENGNVEMVDLDKKGQGDNRMEQDDDEKFDETKYGGCLGPESMFVKLISSDEIEFIIERKFAFQSETIKDMLSGPGQFGENETTEIHFSEFPSHVLDIVCKYFMYKARYSRNPSGRIPEFVFDPKMALELLMAANFFRC